MLEFLRPIVEFDTWLYIGLGLLALFFLRAMWLARNDRVRSIFTLERENATMRLTRYFTGFMITLGLILGVYYLSLITPRIVPPPAETPTPTPILELPPTPTVPPLLPTPTITPTPLPVSTTELPAAVTGETTPTPASPPPPAPQVQSPSCPHPGSRIFQPGNGARVAGEIQITGAASIENFDYYKFEFRSTSSQDWNFITRYDNSVTEGLLGSWNTDTVPPGEYELRLVVVDSTGNFPEPCVTRVIVQ
jgi:hypothetical protein